MSKFVKAGLFTLLILGFFILMSRIDYMVNFVLYNYGLQFSYAWADSYWLVFNSLFLIFSTIISATYWLASKKTQTDLKISIALFVTISLLALGGLQDLLFFVLWSGGLPSINAVWWWAPWISITGTWNSLMQVSFMTLTTCLSVLTWLMVLKRPKQSKLHVT